MLVFDETLGCNLMSGHKEFIINALDPELEKLIWTTIASWIFVGCCFRP